MIFKKILLELVNRNNLSEDNDARFVALTPTDEAESVEHYIKALTYALGEDSIKNIALTGPYGSGKTSIIRTFEKNRSYNFLNISLASFKEDSGEDETAGKAQNIMIERSILQQMLYGADANKLPYSRFKRISTPDQPLIKSLLVVFWVVAAAYIYLIRAQFLSMEVFKELFWSPIFLISFVLGIPAVLASDIHKSSFGMSLKKISFKNAEIETGDVPETSILNRHLDEIIYFFRATKYDVVVIEDLDRFDSPEIFVKLREINKLINDNKKIKDKIKSFFSKTGGNIKFLYALKDDMFDNRNRTKFFDFIIPVVPIINTSNSLDKMLERLSGEPFAEKIDQQFLREVSLYIDDLRLMHNIFNEFTIYNAKLNSDSLDMTRLLAMMIYKNVYPGDFEKLHHGIGALYEISRLRSKLITVTKQKLNKDIADIKEELSDATNEAVESVGELIKIFVGHVVASSGEPINGVYRNNNELLTFTQLKDWDSFACLFEIPNIQIAFQDQRYSPPRFSPIALGKSFRQLESEVTPNQTFAQRKKNIENKAASKRIELQSNIHRLEKEKTIISQMALHELLLENEVSVEDIISKNKIVDTALLVYLVKNGHLDENYHLYTSNFYEGRLTKNDHDFLLTIRNFKSPDPNQPINTQDEVCKNMRPEDFSHKYVLNIALFDFLLTNITTYQKQVDSAVNYISSNFTETEEFFTAYWDAGTNINDFVTAVSERWPGYGTAAVKSPQAPDHIALILSHLAPKYVADKMNTQHVLTDYLSGNGHLIFASDIPAPNDLTVLKSLSIKFYNLSSMERNKALLDFAHNECLYKINPENIGLLLNLYSNGNGATHPDHMTANYSAICSSGSEELKRYVNDNLSEYIEDVFLVLPDNVKESSGVVRQLVNVGTIDNKQKQQIISKQEIIFEKLEGIPTDLWGFVLTNEKISISWQNISTYIKQEECENGIVTEILNRPHIADHLSAQHIKISELGEADSKALSSFILENDVIKDAVYCKLIKCLPYFYLDFPNGISQVKIHCLAKTGTIRLNEKSFNSAKNDELLLSLLIGSNVKEYLINKEKYPITDTVREKLLSFDMSNEQKMQICIDVTPEGVKANKKLSRYVADVIKLPDVDCALFNNEVVTSAIVHAQNIDDSLQILIKCIPAWDVEITMNVLGQLPTPFSEITEYGKSPKLPKTTTNCKLAKLLEENKIVSSVTEKENNIKINTFKSPD
jgi:hypothetical protein